jgi:guanylate kinase
VARGRLIVIAGPSGVGKGTLVRRLLERDPDGLALSVSATTRLPRQQEVNQVDYLFVTPGEFERMESAGELLESAEVFNGARYGTPAAFVERERAAGRDVILEIDVQGARQIRVRVPDALLILLEPPSMADLERRLRGRGTEDEASIAERLRAAAAELERRDEFDATVTNDDLERAVDEVAAIIEASRTA